MVDGFWAADMVRHDLAHHIAALTGLQLDSLSDAQHSALALDVAALLDAAELRGVMLDAAAVRGRLSKAAEALAEAERALRDLPPDLREVMTFTTPAGTDAAEIVSRCAEQLRCKLHIAEKICADQDRRWPRRVGRPIDNRADFVAYAAIRIFVIRTGLKPTFTKTEDGHMRSRAAQFVDKVFGVLNIDAGALDRGRAAFREIRRREPNLAATLIG